MPNTYKPVTNTAKRKASPTVDSVRNIKRIDSLEPTRETFERITELASFGYSTRSIAYMLGVTVDAFQEFRDQHEDEVGEAMSLGWVIDETECLTKLRGASVNVKSANWLTAMKLYGALKFGWGGKATGTGSADLPRSISFTMIEPDEFDDGEDDAS